MDFVVRTRLRSFEPNGDVFVDEERGQAIVTIEIAGADPETLRAELNDQQLIISGVRSDRARSRCGSFLQKEIAYGEFCKKIHLPVAVEYERASASYADGILVVALPLAATAYVPATRAAIRMIVRRTQV
ncbi:MAG: Hsp20/alpha crystallin family protein [Vulcanimicrobiaceae bacterium]